MANEQKLITLGQLKTSLEATKSYVDKQDAVLAAQVEDILSTIDGIVSVGGEANVLEGVKVNGTALTIADKMVDILIESGSENGTINVNGAAVAVTGLAKLAYMSEISEAELSDALKASIAAKASQTDLDALGVRVTAIEDAGYQTAEQVETIAKAAVAASGHAHFEKVDAIPEASAAEENVMYLVPAEDGDGFVIYAKVGESVEPLGHTKVDLTGYSTTEQMTAAITAAIEGIKIGDYAKLADLNDAVERITAVEARFANYYTKDEAEAKFTDETEAQTIAETAASAAVEAAAAADEDVSAAVDEIFGSEA